MNTKIGKYIKIEWRSASSTNYRRQCQKNIVFKILLVEISDTLDDGRNWKTSRIKGIRLNIPNGLIFTLKDHKVIARVVIVSANMPLQKSAKESKWWSTLMFFIWYHFRLLCVISLFCNLLVWAVLMKSNLFQYSHQQVIYLHIHRGWCFSIFAVVVFSGTLALCKNGVTQNNELSKVT